MKQLKTDVAIIGAGTAGMAAYHAVKSSGLQALLIEGGAYGTTCARVGCMPSKLLIAAADAAHSAAHAQGFGVHVDNVRVDGVQVMDRVKSERDRFVGFVVATIDAMPAQDKVRGYARFLSDTLLQVDEHTQIEASRIIIATGSVPAVSDMYRALGDRLVINDDVFEWDDLPKRVLVVGTGVIGLELGQALARLGVHVRVVGRSQSLAGISDPEVKASALDAFVSEFSLLLDTDIRSVQRAGDEVEVRYAQKGQPEVLERFDYVLVSTGRTPNTAALGLENTSAVLDKKGVPEFNGATMQIGASSIFIAGDVNGDIPLLHEASDDGHIAGNNAARFPNVEVSQRRARLSVVFTDPQIAHIGVHFKNLPPSGVVIGEVDFKNQGRSRVLLKNYGKLRVYVSKPEGRFLGAEMAGPSAEHIGHLLAWSVQQEMTVFQMLKMPFYHPVIEEGLRTALRHAARQLSQ